jgi:hypothetical protein
MRSNNRAASALLAAALLVAPALAQSANDDVDAQLRAMQAQLQQMEDKLQSNLEQLSIANDRVDEQSLLIEEAGIAEGRGASSGLPGFLGEITIGGSVSATYFHNLNDPQDADGPYCDFVEEGFGDGGLGCSNQGINGSFYPLHPDHNSFAFQSLWLELSREISEEHRAGFVFETAYGKDGQLNNVGGISNRDANDDTGLYISQAYVQYLAPLGDGLTLKAGKFGTVIGNELANNLYNWNITHGSVYQLLEPLDHIGLIAEYAFGDTGFDMKAGVVNGYFPDDPDINDAKSVLGHVGWSNDMVSIGGNVIWGGENQGRDGGEGGVANGVLTIQATERLAFWVNGDYNWLDDEDGAAWGVAAAARFAITERTGIALRGEYVADVDRYLGFVGFTEDEFGEEVFADTGIEVWGLTLTLDHLLTDHLMIRSEVRYDNINKDSTDNDEFFKDSEDFSNDQIVLGAQVIYNFNKFGGE